MNAIKQLSFRSVTRPMKTLFTTSLGSKNVATSVLVKATLKNAATGLGEVPTSFAFPLERVEAIKKILGEAKGEIVGADIDDYPQMVRRLRDRFPEYHMTVSGLEVALFRAWLSHHGKGEHRHWGGLCGRLTTDITIPFNPKGKMLEQWLGRAADTGFSTYKVKVSGHVDADIRFIRRAVGFLNANLGRPFTIRLDGNQGYTEKTYMEMIARLERERIEIELFEQPLKKDDFRGLKAIRPRSPVPVILDETVFNGAACRRAIEDGLGDGVNIKIAKSGIAESAAILKLAGKAGLKLMIGCMTETMVGLSAGIFMAAGTGAFDYIDLDSVHLLADKTRCPGITVAGENFTIKDA